MHAWEPLRRVTTPRPRRHDVDSAAVNRMPSAASPQDPTLGLAASSIIRACFLCRGKAVGSLLPHTVSDRLLTPKLNVFQVCTQFKPSSLPGPISISPLHTCASAPVPIPRAGCSCLLQAFTLWGLVCFSPLCVLPHCVWADSLPSGTLMLLQCKA